LNEDRKVDYLSDDKGILLRSKAQWIEGFEKNNALFANLEKRGYQKKMPNF